MSLSCIHPFLALFTWVTRANSRGLLGLGIDSKVEGGTTKRWVADDLGTADIVRAEVDTENASRAAVADGLGANVTDAAGRLVVDFNGNVKGGVTVVHFVNVHLGANVEVDVHLGVAVDLAAGVLSARLVLVASRVRDGRLH